MLANSTMGSSAAPEVDEASSPAPALSPSRSRKDRAPQTRSFRAKHKALYGSERECERYDFTLCRRQDHEGNLLRKIEDLLPLSRLVRVADVGAGTGKLSRLLAPRVRSVSVIDRSEFMIAVARKLCSGRNDGDGQVSGGECNLSYHCADARQLPLTDASVELALSAWTLSSLKAEHEEWDHDTGEERSQGTGAGMSGWRAAAATMQWLPWQQGSVCVASVRRSCSDACDCDRTVKPPPCREAFSCAHPLRSRRAGRGGQSSTKRSTRWSACWSRGASRSFSRRGARPVQSRKGRALGSTRTSATVASKRLACALTTASAQQVRRSRRSPSSSAKESLRVPRPCSRT